MATDGQNGSIAGPHGPTDPIFAAATPAEGSDSAAARDSEPFDYLASDFHPLCPYPCVDWRWKWAEEIGKFDKVTLKYCKMAAHASMEAASVPAAAEIAWLMQEEHALVNPRAYAGTKEFHK